mmetsp:Transcript_18408/g.52423  ORF Transcript_18408/g.52423 Transcript_18408/m.52423 type:complete len:311 (-) Transcript_18408:413-1345(-)
MVPCLRTQPSGSSLKPSARSRRSFIEFNRDANFHGHASPPLKDHHLRLPPPRGTSGREGNNASRSSREGREGCAPSFVTAAAPAAAAWRRAVLSSKPSARATAKAARNASPAAVSSTAFIDVHASPTTTPSFETRRHPLEPSVARTLVAPLAIKTWHAASTSASEASFLSRSLPVKRASSDTFGATYVHLARCSSLISLSSPPQSCTTIAPAFCAALATTSLILSGTSRCSSTTRAFWTTSAAQASSQLCRSQPWFAPLFTTLSTVPPSSKSTKPWPLPPATRRTPLMSTFARCSSFTKTSPAVSDPTLP